ncbi:hypothetical protein, partial [Ochrobactrum sp. C6C9]|uniref:hypothetical protein n=1 Tax=Ochrobactrum sp. C6C9 TaxID=2736662 RepID=UPI00353023C7
GMDVHLVNQANDTAYRKARILSRALSGPGNLLHRSYGFCSQFGNSRNSQIDDYLTFGWLLV